MGVLIFIEFPYYVVSSVYLMVLVIVREATKDFFSELRQLITHILCVQNEYIVKGVKFLLPGVYSNSWYTIKPFITNHFFLYSTNSQKLSEGTLQIEKI